MAIANYNGACLGSTSGSSITTAFDVGSGSNRLLVVFVMELFGTVTGVTYNSVAMNASVTTTDDQTGTLRLFYLVGPDSGSNNVVITASGGNFMIGHAASYTGVSALDATKVQRGTIATTDTITNATVADNCWVVGCFRADNSGADLVAGTGATLRSSGTGQTFYNNTGVFDSAAAVTPAGSYSMTVGNQNAYWADIWASFSPAGGSPPADAQEWLVASRYHRNKLIPNVAY